MTASTHSGAPKEKKYVLYWVIGIVVAILVAVLLIWNSGFFIKGTTAATVGEEKYSVAEMGYYYQAVANNTINTAQQYKQYGIDMGYDTTLSPSAQYYDEENGVTYADYFLETALSNLQDVSVLCAQAKKDGYTLSEDGQASLKANQDALSAYSAQSNYSESAYLKLLYGKYMTKSIFNEALSNSLLAQEYSTWKSEQFTYTDANLEDYYKENAATLDSYEYRYCYIPYEAETKTDDEGNAVDPTEEEIAAAMEVASGKANALVADVEGGAVFNEAAAKYVSEAAAESYSDPDYNLVTGAMGSSLSSNYSEWLMEDGRAANDVTSIEVENTGYYVVQFLSRSRDDNSYQTMDYSNILILAETTEGEDGTSAPTDEQLADAKTKAEALLTQWESGEATVDTFAALAKENSADETNKEDGGLNKDANRDSINSTASTWLFDAARKEGDTTIVEYTDSSNTVTGYQILYAGAFGEIQWKYQATNSLRTEDYDNWLQPLRDASPVAQADGIKYVINQ